jgi:hypothetical protein
LPLPFFSSPLPASCVPSLQTNTITRQLHVNDSIPQCAPYIQRRQSTLIHKLSYPPGSGVFLRQSPLQRGNAVKHNMKATGLTNKLYHAWRYLTGGAISGLKGQGENS